MNADPQGHLDEQGLSDAVDALQGPAADAHLASCPMCRARLAAWQATSQLLGAFPPAPPAERVDHAVSIAVAGRRPRSGLRRGFRSPVVQGLAAAACLAAVVAVVAAALAGSHAGPTAGSIARPAAVATGAPPAARSGSAATSSAASPASSAAVPGAASGQSGHGTPRSTPSSVAEGSEAPAQSGAPDLGPIADAAALGSSLRPVLAVAQPRVAALPCIVMAAGQSGLGPAVYDARLTFAGQAAQVFVYRTAGSARAVVDADTGCQELVATDL